MQDSAPDSDASLLGHVADPAPQSLSAAAWVYSTRAQSSWILQVSSLFKSVWLQEQVVTAVVIILRVLPESGTFHRQTAWKVGTALTQKQIAPILSRACKTECAPMLSSKSSYALVLVWWI